MNPCINLLKQLIYKDFHEFICNFICKMEGDLFLAEQLIQVILQLCVVFDFFFFDRMLIGGFQHVVCSMPHALHAVLVRDSNGEH